ncbi:hypothetical protein GOODEAATRI_034656 [Goodea atripinnis]|uniref:Uncharacterized protein n=1 Tax=Goodea atripinnis TaxID=208336 RepID=A0ABV0N6L5_9TELE
MQNRGAAGSTSTDVFLNVRVCVLSRPLHLCPMGTMIITRVALFTSNSSLANVQCENKPHQMNKIKFAFGPVQTSRPKDFPGVKTPLRCVHTKRDFCERSGQFTCYPYVEARSGAERCEGRGGRGAEGAASEAGAERWTS